MKKKVIFFSILLIVLIIPITIIYRYINFRREMEKGNELFKERVEEYIKEHFTSEIEILRVGKILGSGILSASVRSVDNNVYFSITENYSLKDDYYESYFAKLLEKEFLPYAEDIFNGYKIRVVPVVESETFGNFNHLTLGEDAELKDVKNKIQRRFGVTFWIDKNLKIDDDNEKLYNLLHQVKKSEYTPNKVSFNFTKKGEKYGVFYRFTIEEIMEIDNIDDFTKIMQDKIKSET